jgi:hypothetical protein
LKFLKYPKPASKIVLILKISKLPGGVNGSSEPEFVSNTRNWRVLPKSNTRLAQDLVVWLEPGGQL